MNIKRIIALAVIAGSCGLGYAQAKTLRDAGEPAEFPPASYEGRQYVDSNGCVFVRAGIDGNVTWVPRVSRSRKVVCGFQPTMAKARRAPEPKAEPAPTVAAAPKPKKATKRVVRTTPAKVQPKRTAKRVVRAPAPAPAPVTTPRRKAAPVLAAPAPAPKPVATAPAPKRRVARAPSGCAGRSAVSMRYMGSSQYAVRCGPQTAGHVTYSRNAAAPRRVAPAPVYTRAPKRTTPSYQPAPANPATAPRTGHTAATRVAPRHVYENQMASYHDLGGMPEGYKRVWMDGRLNPHRAHQTFAGKAQMDLVWTKTTPRRLIVRRTGRVVTQDYPGLMYPYTSYAQQKRANVATPYVSSKGTARATTRKATVSTRTSAPEAPAQKARPASHRYVQAGVYTSRAQARQAARRIAGVGLPARLGTMRRNGQTYSLLLAGPFKSQAQLNTAMSRVRGAGFGNARLRK